MIKSIAFMPRRSDLGRAAFRDYYETRHTPLALRYFRFARYIRNHLADDQEPGFDCLSEFWHPDPAASAARIGAAVVETLRADERVFTDQSNIRAALAEEIPLLATQPDAQPVSADATILILHGTDRAALISAASQTARARSGQTTLDLLSPFDHRPIPCDALLILRGSEPFSFTPPSGWSISHRLPVLTEETPADILANSPEATT
ncbi:EthD domain-containing protein [Sphingomonas sp. KC8]|uniref:EthD domain-containing protein n=1 Tax=Sphingomonas sp. KC8 TaxID=1030157 RepID=UPI000248981D|nr:EthD domain-containing protein [Sphingomonas sp. KC8]